MKIDIQLSFKKIFFWLIDENNNKDNHIVNIKIIYLWCCRLENYLKK
jgi:hypothetical protein